MKKTLLLLFFALLFMGAKAQVTVQYEVIQYCERWYNDKSQKWGDWSDWKKTPMLIVNELDQITIYDSPKQVYRKDIIGKGWDGTYNNGNKYSTLYCTDQDGESCIIEESDGDEFYIKYHKKYERFYQAEFKKIY